MTVQFSKALIVKALRYGNKFSEQRTKSVFVEDLLLNVRDNMCMFWAEKPTMRFRQLAQYANTRTQEGGSKLSSP